ncbi:unnamed protein product [Phyllotreta striolata]|uniref:Uncharacterized protein n=1 Tax=Phyllotreta striolata TaxID=444603 RepID=A0A9N9XLL7_PHYSR|nr:unnamed protein product [Phyllotreta striolata]
MHKMDITWAYSAILLTLTLRSGVVAESRVCQRPLVNRQLVFIYQPLSQDKVQVYRCRYKYPGRAYSDVSDQCLSALVTHRFVDKWNQSHDLNDPKAPVIVEDQVARYADPDRNLIQLRSHTICRYDRGFCYDPRESPDYAAVWRVRARSPPGACADRLQQIYFGPADVWTFPAANQSYLLASHCCKDESFYLKLTGRTRCRGKPAWTTDRPGLVASPGPLRGGYVPAKKTGEPADLPMRSKRHNSEAILMDCDLSAFGVRLDEEYLERAGNLRIIFESYRGLIEANRKSTGDVRKVLDRYRAVLNAKFKDLNRVKVMLGLLITRFDRFNGSSSVNYTDDLYSKMKRLNESLVDLRKSINPNDCYALIDNVNATFSITAKNIQTKNEQSLKQLTQDTQKLNQNTTKIFEHYIHQITANLTSTKIELIDLIDTTAKSKSIEFDAKLTNYSTIILNDISLHSNNFLQKLDELQNDLKTNFTYLKNYTKPQQISRQNLTSLNSSISSQINRTNFKLQNLQNQLANYESLIGDKVDDSIKNVSKLLESIPAGIRIEMLDKIDSAANKTGRNCSDKIAASEKSTRKLIEQLRGELISLIESGDGVISEEINKIIAKLKNYDILRDSIRRIENDSIAASQLTQKSIKEINNNLTTIRTNYTQLDKNISEKFDQFSLLVIKQENYFNDLIIKIKSKMDALPSQLDRKYSGNIDKLNDLESNLRSKIGEIRLEVTEMDRKIGEKFIKIDFIDYLRRNLSDIFAKLENRINDKQTNLLKYLDKQTVNTTNKINCLENGLNSTIDYVAIINQTLIETNDSLKEKIDSNAENIQKLYNNFNKLNFVFNITSLIDSKINSAATRTESILDTFKIETASLDTEIKNLKNDLIAQKSNLSGAIDKNTIDINQLKIDFNVLETKQLDESKSTQQTIDLLVKNATISEKRIDDNEKTIKDLENRLEKLQKSKEIDEKRYNDTITDLRGLINEKGEEILYLKQQLSNINKCCNNHDLKFAEKDKQIDDLKKEIEKTNKEMKKKIDKIINDIGMIEEVEIQ